MFIKTVKIKSFWAVITVLSIVAVAVAAIIFASSHARERSEVYRMTSEHQRQEFISSLGWETAEEYDTCRIVIIPSEFDEVYTRYNDLQKQQGFDLEGYKGKTVEIYSYPVYNYPQEDNVMLSLLVCDGRLIGGDVCSTKLDGFMQGLKKLAQDSQDGTDSVVDSDITDSSDTDAATDSSSETGSNNLTDSSSQPDEKTDNA